MISANEPVWLERERLIEAHDLTIARHGGLPGFRDEGAFDSALSRPINKWTYGEADIVALAAAYGFGLARNHAFSDGNKRISYVATRAFLEQNGFHLIASEADKIATFLALAAGALSEGAGGLAQGAGPAGVRRQTVTRLISASSSSRVTGVS